MHSKTPKYKGVSVNHIECIDSKKQDQIYLIDIFSQINTCKFVKSDSFDNLAKICPVPRKDNGALVG